MLTRSLCACGCLSVCACVCAYHVLNIPREDKIKNSVDSEHDQHICVCGYVRVVFVYVECVCV